MPKYKKTSVTSKIGVNFVRNVVEETGSLFHKIEQENDLGIDGIIEFIKDRIPTSKSIAVQIKSGKSYFNLQNTESLIPVDDHYEYWKNYPLPVYGVVYSPELKKGFWVNIKDYLRAHGKCSVIRYANNKANELDLDSFKRLFSPLILRDIPDLSFEEALSLFDSQHYDEIHLGLIVLFRRYVNRKIVWEKFSSYFIDHDIQNIPYSLIYYFAHIPWHGDIAYSGEPISQEIKEYVQDCFNKFDTGLIIKLLEFIDEENGISRGAIGQSVEAIISSISDVDTRLEDIIRSKEVPIQIRHNAALIFAYHKGKAALPVLRLISEAESWLIPEIVKQIEQFGGIDLY
jgi:hypothetical protein